MKTTSILILAGLVCMLLPACTMFDVERAIDTGFALLNVVAPLVSPEKMASLNQAIAGGAEATQVALGAVAEVLHAVNTEASAKFAEQAVLLQQQAAEIQARVTTDDALLYSAGSTLLGAGAGTGASRGLSALKHGFAGKSKPAVA